MCGAPSSWSRAGALGAHGDPQSGVERRRGAVLEHGAREPGQRQGPLRLRVHVGGEGRRPHGARALHARRQIYPGYWDAWAGRGRMERDLGDLAASRRRMRISCASRRSRRTATSGSGWRARASATSPAPSAPPGQAPRPSASLPLAFRLAGPLGGGRPGPCTPSPRARDRAGIAARTGAAECSRAGRREEARAQIADVSAAPDVTPARSKVQNPNLKSKSLVDALVRAPPSSASREERSSSRLRAAALRHARMPAVIEGEHPSQREVRPEPDQRGEERRPDEERRQTRTEPGAAELDPEVVVQDALPAQGRHAGGGEAEDRAPEPVAQSVERRQRPGVADQRTQHRVELVQPED